MSDIINDGGPAFPQSVAVWESSEPLPPGMTLRDWFAGMALQGMAASSTWSDNVSVQKGETKSEWMDEVARHAYVMADSMLAQREKKI